MELIKKLHEMRHRTGPSITKGLEDSVITSFAAHDKDLSQGIDTAYTYFQAIEKEFGEKLKLPEAELITFLQNDFVNFYEANSVNPYVAIHAQGPWVFTAHGAVLHDSGGYGMLGFGHAPKAVIDVMSGKQVMANIMTANFSQKRITEKLKKEIGHTRKSRDGLFTKFL
ncbi:MAG: lysine 6-aminotransferase, partial [Proteobacteria bacterium]